jgi:hypothetical protein
MRDTEIRTMYYIISLRYADIQRQVANRNEREENDLSRWGIETILGKRRVRNLLHYEREKLHSVFLSSNREIKRGEWGRGVDASCARERRAIHMYCFYVRKHGGGKKGS